MSLESSLLFVRAPLGGLTTKAAQDAAKATQTFLAQFSRTAATPGGFLQNISNFFGKIGQAGARTQRGKTTLQQIPLTPTKTTIPLKTIAVSTAVTAGSVGLLFAGPEIAKETAKTAQIFKPLFEGIGDIGKTISSSPLLTGGSIALVGLVLLGGLLLLKK